MASYSSEVLDTIQNISPVEWNAAVGESVGVRHAVLTCYESGDSKAKQFRYFLLRDEQCLQAVCVAMLVCDDNEVGVARMVLGRLAEKSSFLQNCFRPALICGLLRGPCSPVLVRPDSNQDLWLPRIVDVMEKYALKHRIALGFTGILPEQTRLIKELSNRGYCGAYGLPETKIRITWTDERTYLKTLRAKSKSCYQMAKNEINRFRRSDISIAKWDGQHESSLYALLKQHYEDRNDSPFELQPNFLSVIKDAFSDDILVYMARNREKLVGVCVLLKRGQDGWLWKTGIDHEADANNFTYFNLNYYHVFREAPACGLRQIRCGNAALDAKTRRGCEAELTHFFYKPRTKWMISTLRILFSIQKFWYRRKFSPYLAAQSLGAD